jgi:hypothetical protein
VSENLVPTPVGTARITWYPARGSARAVALLGHGSVTGIESAALVTQPYRLEANPGAVLATSMTRITAAVSSWIDSQLA